MNRPPAWAGALRKASSCGSDGRTTSGRVTLTIGTAWAVGSTPVTFEGLQFLDVAEDAAELRAEFFFLVGCELEPRQVRDIFDIKLSR